MKSFNQFCSEAIYFIEMSDFSAGGGNAKMRQTGMTRDQVIALGRKNLARLKNKPAAAAPKPAAPTPKPAATSTSRPTRPAPALSPRPKDERPTRQQVMDAERAAETRRYRDTASFSAGLGGVSQYAAQLGDANRNSLVMRGAEQQRKLSQPAYKQTAHYKQGKVGRGYGSQRLSDMLQDNSTSQLTDFYLKKYPGMSYNAANKKACLLYTSPSPRDATLSRMPSSA